MSMYNEMAQQLKQQIDVGKVPDDSKESMMKTVEVYSFLAEVDDRGLLQELAETLFNEGIFNDAIKGYVAMALKEVGVDQLIKDSIESNVRYLLDTKTAEEAAKYYRES